MAKFNEHYTPGIETGKWGEAFKNERKMNILNAHANVKEGISRGDTTANLHNLLVPSPDP